MITDYDERIQMLDDRISKAVKKRSSEGFIAGLMNLRNREVILKIMNEYRQKGVYELWVA